MKKNQWTLTLLGLFLPLTVFADSIFLNEIGDKRYRNDKLNGGRNLDFVEQTLPLPAMPNPQQGEWIELYIDETYAIRPKILLESLELGGDGSIRYILNTQSQHGSHNVSAEGLVCVSGAEVFTSQSSKVKTFAYADLYNQKWILARRSEWKTIDPNLSYTDKIRRAVYDVFCTEQRASNVAELQTLLKKAHNKKQKNW